MRGYGPDLVIDLEVPGLNSTVKWIAMLGFSYYMMMVSSHCIERRTEGL